jgi:hypothetical protein
LEEEKMLLHEYQIQYDVKPESAIEAYCRMEGMDARAVLGTAERKHSVKTPACAKGKMMGFLKGFAEFARPEQVRKLGADTWRS